MNNLFLLSALVAIIVSAMIAGKATAAAEPRCGAYKKASQPCMAYVQGSAETIPQACCDRLKGFLDDAKTEKRKKIAACKCVAGSASNPAYKEGRVQKVADACGFKLPPADYDCDSL
ncbi:unnamed protein product [Linum trigynum]|uniref:Bifunctional inhibitor/plant lipid transfer protein/seed storage helical domain-containing protein n=1 Tax=Linum trigynum TaxID=586398 RepID=A0AAV2FXM8_9ROSI